ncbi:MAG: hypothetical protein QW270_05740 [Candidatus Bathyarchaeia archaeon]
MTKQFITIYNPDNFPTEITEKLNLEKGDIIIITIEKLYLEDKNIKKNN